MSKTIIEINPAFSNLDEEIRRLFKLLVKGKEENRLRLGNSDWIPEDAEYIYRGRNNLFRVMLDGKPFIVKDFKHPHFLNRYVYTTIRKSKAARSYANALRILSLGFNTPAPAAYFEMRKKGELYYSFYLCEELCNASEMRNWEDKKDADTLLRAFALEILRLHRNGVFHRDFTPGNILYVTPGKGIYNFYLIDLNRMKFGIRKFRKQIRMFRAINLKPAETERLARLYASAAGLDAEMVSKYALKELKKYLRKKKIG